MNQSAREAERGKRGLVWGGLVICVVITYCCRAGGRYASVYANTEKKQWLVFFLLYPIDLQRALYSAKGESYALIFNIVNFAPPSLLPTRCGSEKDAKEAKKVLEERNCTVHSFPDCTADEIRRRLEVIGKDQRNFERFVCVNL